jgi:glycerophosphoryl diester phosphodiesterase
MGAFINLKLYSIIILSLLLSSAVMGQNEYKIFGHRGCRGIYPENTINGFKKAILLGVDGIELDVVVNKNQELIISHESYIDTNYCLTSKLDEESLNIYKMNVSEIQEIDCGSKFIKEFPNQLKIKETKPTYKEFKKELIDYQGDILFEIKCNYNLVNEYFPDYENYAKIIFEETRYNKHLEKICFMSFDFRIINELYKIMPNSKYIFLSSNKEFRQEMKLLNFEPFGVGLDYNIINQEIIDFVHNKKQVIYGWTINDEENSKTLTRMGLDGVITDYPNKIKK